MNLSLSSISAGAMTAAVSLGSSLQALGAGAASAAQALPTVTAGGLQAASQRMAAATANASAQAGSVVASIPQALPGSVHAGAATTSGLARDLALVEKPTKAVAAAMPKAGFLVRTATFLSKALPVITIGAGALSGARIASDQGVQALVTTKDGRNAVMSTLGGALLLVPHPAGQLAAAGMLAGVAVNQFGGLDRLDDVKLGARAAQPGASQVTGPVP